VISAEERWTPLSTVSSSLHKKIRQKKITTNITNPLVEFLVIFILTSYILGVVSLDMER